MALLNCQKLQLNCSSITTVIPREASGQNGAASAALLHQSKVLRITNGLRRVLLSHDRKGHDPVFLNFQTSPFATQNSVLNPPGTSLRAFGNEGGVYHEVECANGGEDGGSGGRISGGGDRGDNDDNNENSSSPEPDRSGIAAGIFAGLCGVFALRECGESWVRVPSAILAGLLVFLSQQQAALALSGAKEEKEAVEGIWEVKRGRWRYMVKDPESDEFVVETVKNSEEEARAYEEELVERQKQGGDQKKEAGDGEKRQKGFENGVDRVFTRFVDIGKQLLLPEGYPGSVTEDYMEYTLWRMGQIIASQISGVLTTQVNLFHTRLFCVQAPFHGLGFEPYENVTCNLQVDENLIL